MLDKIIIITYLLLTLFIGVYFSKKRKSIQEFSHIGSDIRNNHFILMATIFATAVGAGTTFGLADKAYRFDMSYCYGIVLATFVDFLIAYKLVPKMRKYSSMSTASDLMEIFYGKTGRVITGLASMMICLGFLAAQINISGQIFEYITGFDYNKAIIISYIIVIVYTSIGGMRSVVITDLLQFVFVVLAIPLMIFFGFKEIGGTEKFFINLSSSKYYSNQIFIHSISLALSFSLMSLHPTYIQRIFLGKDTKQVQKAIFQKILIYIPFVFIISLIGLQGSVIYFTNTEQNIVSLIIHNIVPVGIKGIILVGLLAALMSTADSNLYLASISFVNDLIKQIDLFKGFEIKKREKYLLIITRISLIVFGSSSIFIALRFKDVLDLVIFMSGFWSPVIFFPMLLGIYDVVISKRNFLYAALSSVLFFSIYSYFGFEDKIMIKAILASSLFNLLWYLPKIREKFKKCKTSFN